MLTPRIIALPRIRTLDQQVREIFEHGNVDGFVYDANDISTVNQTSTGTTPVTAVTQPVGLQLDKRMGIQSSTKGAYMAGAAGTYLSTPDSVAASITGDIDISVKVALTDWTPATNQFLVSKIMNAGQYGYDFRVNGTTGVLVFRTSVDGTALQIQTSSVAPTVTDGATLYIRVKRISATGVATFYTSTDGFTWSQLGTTIASVAGAIFDGTDALRIGEELSAVITGKVYSVHIYNGIRDSGGTLAVNFNGTDYSTGSTLTSSTTGEVWTLNGATYIAPDGNHAIQATAAARPTWQVDTGAHHYLQCLAVDDSLTSATGDAATTGFILCAALNPTGGAGTIRSLFDCTGTNTGYKVQFDASNKLSFSAGNGSAFTTLASTATADVGTLAMFTCIDDGTNLSVQINEATAETVARPVVSAGTAGFTLFKKNGAASEFLQNDFYRAVYIKNFARNTENISKIQRWVQAGAGL